MFQKIFLTVFAMVFLALLTVQGYFALDEDIALEMRAERMGMELSDEKETRKAGESLGGLTVYLSVEREDGEPSEGIFTVNGVEAGDFRRGVLTVAVEEGDILGIKNAQGETFQILDYPENLDSKSLSPTIFCDQTVTKWGKISFK